MLKFSIEHFCINENIVELEYKDDVAAPWDDHQSIPHGQNCLDRYFCHRQSFSDGDYDSVPIAYDRPKDMMEKNLFRPIVCFGS